MNSHNANTAVLCFELYCGILPYLEHFSSKEIFMFLQAFNFKKNGLEHISNAVY